MAGARSMTDCEETAFFAETLLSVERIHQKRKHKSTDPSTGAFLGVDPTSRAVDDRP